SEETARHPFSAFAGLPAVGQPGRCGASIGLRSEEHTSELQSLTNLVCRLLLEKKKRFKIDSASDLDQELLMRAFSVFLVAIAGCETNAEEHICVEGLVTPEYEGHMLVARRDSY